MVVVEGLVEMYSRSDLSVEEFIRKNNNRIQDATVQNNLGAEGMKLIIKKFKKRIMEDNR